MKKFLREAALLALAVAPSLYLAFIYKSLPDRVPVHFGLNGEADDWGNKSSLWFTEGMLSLVVYLLLLVIPVLDPKKRIREMGDKYVALRVLMGFFFSALAIYMLHTTVNGQMNPRLLVGLFGLLFVGVGNYLQTVRPNYFIGIRTPWALENEDVWKSTHRLGGRLCMAGGALIVVLALLVTGNTALFAGFISIVGIIVLVPFVHSYLLFRKITKA